MTDQPFEVAMAICSSVRVLKVVDLNVSFFVEATSTVPFIKTIAEEFVNGQDDKSILSHKLYIGPFTVVSELQPKNFETLESNVYLTFIKLKPDKFKEVNELQLSNIADIFSTLEVSKEDKSKFLIGVFQNIYVMSVTLDVSKEDKSNLLKELHLANILPIFVTLDVSIEEKSMLFKLMQYQNILYIFLTFDVDGNLVICFK